MIINLIIRKDKKINKEQMIMNYKNNHLDLTIKIIKEKDLNPCKNIKIKEYLKNNIRIYNFSLKEEIIKALIIIVNLIFNKIKDYLKEKKILIPFHQ